MVANRMDAPKPGGDPGKGAPAPAPEVKPAEVKSTASGGIKAWIPLIVALVAMPVLAYAMTVFVLAPRLEKAMGKTATATTEKGEGKKSEGKKGEAKASETHGEKAPEKASESEGKKGGEKEGSKKEVVPVKKVLVNIAGTAGTRYLLAGISVVGTTTNLKEKVEEHQDQLMDLACGILSIKTITDLEKPGIRNIIRTELMTAFNGVLGTGTIQEIYLTEFAVQ